MFILKAFWKAFGRHAEWNCGGFLVSVSAGHGPLSSHRRSTGPRLACWSTSIIDPPWLPGEYRSRRRAFFLGVCG